jgi:hypothetical protein
MIHTIECSLVLRRFIFLSNVIILSFICEYATKDTLSILAYKDNLQLIIHNPLRYRYSYFNCIGYLKELYMMVNPKVSSLKSQ